MTTIGVSIAHKDHYDVVTPSVQFHETLLATKEEEIFDILIAEDQPAPALTMSQARNDLGQLVITLTGINFQALRPEVIPELQESKHFRKFQREIRRTANRTVGADSQDEYQRQLKADAEDIVAAWHNAQNDIGSSLRSVLFDQSAQWSGEALNGWLHSPTVDPVDLLIQAGIGVFAITTKVFGDLRKGREEAPLEYLTELLKAEDPVLRITFPLGLER